MSTAKSIVWLLEISRHINSGQLGGLVIDRTVVRFGSSAEQQNRTIRPNLVRLFGKSMESISRVSVTGVSICYCKLRLFSVG